MQVGSGEARDRRVDRLLISDLCGPLLQMAQYDCCLSLPEKTIASALEAPIAVNSDTLRFMSSFLTHKAEVARHLRCLNLPKPLESLVFMYAQPALDDYPTTEFSRYARELRKREFGVCLQEEDEEDEEHAESEGDKQRKCSLTAPGFDIYNAMVQVLWKITV